MSGAQWVAYETLEAKVITRCSMRALRTSFIVSPHACFVQPRTMHVAVTHVAGRCSCQQAEAVCLTHCHQTAKMLRHMLTTSLRSCPPVNALTKTRTWAWFRVSKGKHGRWGCKVALVVLYRSSFRAVAVCSTHCPAVGNIVTHADNIAALVHTLQCAIMMHSHSRQTMTPLKYIRLPYTQIVYNIFFKRFLLALNHISIQCRRGIYRFGC